MKYLMKIMRAFVLLSATPLVYAQAGPDWTHLLVHPLPGIGSPLVNPIQVTSDQSTDLAKCMAETKQVQNIVDQMSRIGRPWGRGHIDYSHHDLLVFAEREQALTAAIIALTTAHGELHKNLAEIHDRNLEKHLQKLDRLQAKLYSGSSQIGRDLSAARPGPWSVELSWDVYAVRKAANEWHAEHEQIARELDLAM